MKLYLVGTPIGNLGDITLRALETLKAVDFIACEDTRVSRKLLTRFDIHKPLVSYYEHNSRASGQAIAERIQSGQSCALITDAGMPVISDPGNDLVKLCVNAGITVDVIPGASAVVTALAHSWIGSGRFCFEGFLSTARQSRNQHLQELKTEIRTIVFYEAPHKLLATLRDCVAVFGDRQITICREMTKFFQEVQHTTLNNALAHFEKTPPKGEFVLIIEGASPPAECTLEQALELAQKYISEDMSVRDAAKKASADTKFSRREIYEQLVKG